MKTALRIALLVAVAWQGWHAWTATRYERDYREGIRAYEQARIDDVGKGLEAALSLDAGDAELWAWLGDSTLYTYDYNNDGVEIDLDLGNRLLDEAWEAYAESILRCPSYAWSWSGLARVALRKIRLMERTEGIDITILARMREGVWEPTRALGLAAGTVAANLRGRGFEEIDVLSEVYAASGNRERARELLVQSARMMPAPSLHQWSEGARFYGAEYRALLEALEEGISRAPEFEWDLLYIETGRFASRQSDPRRALEYFRRAERYANSDYQRYRSLWEQAVVLEELGQYDSALEALNRVIEGPFRHRDALRRIARVNDVLGRYEEACVAYRRILVQEPHVVSLRLRASRNCEEAGEHFLAKRLLEEGFISPLDEIQLARALMEFYDRNGRTRSLNYRLERWLAEYPESPELKEWAAEFGVEIPVPPPA